MIPGSTNTLLLASAGAAEYQIQRSVRFNSADSAYLSRTPSVAGNRKTWTWAGWVKFSAVSGNYGIFEAPFQSGGAGVLSDVFEIWYQGGIINLTDYGNYYFSSAALFRDPSAWQHLVFVCDTTQASASDRFKVYHNSARITNTAPTVITQNLDTAVNNSAPHSIGRWRTSSANAYFADIHFIDGQALDPTSFGEFDTNGVWQPKAYSGTYGTNGFHLPFSDNSTSAALGTDTSGNGNTWTVNNISVAAGSGNDSLVDTPTNYGTDTGAGGEVRGNYATLNPLSITYGSGTLTNGNLKLVPGGSDWTNVNSTIAITGEKIYFEATNTDTPSSSRSDNNRGAWIGLRRIKSQSNWLQNGTDAYSLTLNDMGYLRNGGSALDAVGAKISTGDVVGFAYDGTNGTYKILVNGVSKSSGSVSTANYSAGDQMYIATASYPDSGGFVFGNFALNFGQRPFAYTAPSGYKALCTQNLPDPTITDGSTAMDVALYTGNGGTQTISGLGFSPDLVWSKARSYSYGHALFDSVRGPGKYLATQVTGGESDLSPNGLTAFNSDGWAESAVGGYNANGTSYVAWTWDAGSSTVTNNDGSISSQVRANPSAGFSVVSWTGDNSTGTVGHGLGVLPSIYIIKDRSVANDWYVYTTAVDGSLDYGFLNSTSAIADSALAYPTSSSFTVTPGINTSSNNYIAYCFAPVEGYSAFGSYTGNGSADGPFVYTGFRPKWLMVKRSDGVTNWYLQDAVRNTYNATNSLLWPNLSNAEVSAVPVDFLSNGFKPRNTDAGSNGSGGTYIYAAFAENPFKTARAR